MPLSTNLTDTEKRTMREIVKTVGKLSPEKEKDHMVFIKTQQGPCFLQIGTFRIKVPNRGVLETLEEEGLLSCSANSSGKRNLYRLKRRGKEAVKRNFSFSTQIEKLQGGRQDQAAIPQLDFSFLGNAERSAMVERDYEEVRACNSVNAYKAIIVLCGSIIEAILLECLSVKETEAKSAASKLKIKHHNKDIEYWELYELIKVADDMGILTADTKNLSQQLRGYRNVIHPGVEKRKQFEPSSVKAHAAISLVGLIVDDLSN